MAPLVTILTFGAHPALAYGTLLVFKTLRVGFPTARVEVFDNGSHPEVAAAVAREAARVGATFTALRPQHFAAYYHWQLRERAHAGPVVLLDPDVVFWRAVEGWDFGDALLAGRLMPEGRGCGSLVNVQRLHPSLLWVPEPAGLPEGGIAPRLGFRGGIPHFWDTFADLYQAHAGQCVAFDAAQLDAYDHLFHGTHLPVMDTGDDVIRRAHLAAARGDLGALRGLWREQDEHFRAVRATAAPPIGPARAIQAWQGLAFSDADLGAGLATLHERLTSR